MTPIPATPLPVQEPAGAVEAIMEAARVFAACHLRSALADACGRPTIVSTEDEQDKLESIVRAALASPQPVAQAAASNWRAVPGVVWYEDSASLIRRGSEDDYCARKGAQRIYFAAAEPVTQAKSEAVAKIVNGTLAWALASPTDAVPVELLRGEHPLYTAPQEAVERQPLMDADLDAMWKKHCKANSVGGLTVVKPAAFARAVLAAYGIGPATQET